MLLKYIIKPLLAIFFVLLLNTDTSAQILRYNRSSDNDVSILTEVSDTCFNKALWNSISSSVINVMEYSEKITEKSRVQSEIIADKKLTISVLRSEIRESKRLIDEREVVLNKVQKDLTKAKEAESKWVNRGTVIFLTIVTLTVILVN